MVAVLHNSVMLGPALSPPVAEPRQERPVTFRQLSDKLAEERSEQTAESEEETEEDEPDETWDDPDGECDLPDRPQGYDNIEDTDNPDEIYTPEDPALAELPEEVFWKSRRDKTLWPPVWRSESYPRGFGTTNRKVFESNYPEQNHFNWMVKVQGYEPDAVEATQSNMVRIMQMVMTGKSVSDTSKDLGQLRKAIGPDGEALMGFGMVTPRGKGKRRFVPDWTKDDAQVRMLLLNSFPKLADHAHPDRDHAGRWNRVIHLYYRMQISRGQVGSELKITQGQVRACIERMTRAHRGENTAGRVRKQPGSGGRPKNLVTISASIEGGSSRTVEN